LRESLGSPGQIGRKGRQPERLVMETGIENTGPRHARKVRTEPATIAAARRLHRQESLSMSTQNRIFATRRHSTPFTNAPRRKVEDASEETFIELADGSRVNLTRMIGESVARAVAALKDDAYQPPDDVDETVAEVGDTERVRANSSGRPPSLFASMDDDRARRGRQKGSAAEDAVDEDGEPIPPSFLGRGWR